MFRRIIETFFGDALKSVGLWMGYRHSKGLATAGRRGAKAVYRNPHVRDAYDTVLGHYRASRRQFWWVKWPSIVALGGGGLLAIVLHFVPNLGNADEIRHWGETVVVSIVAFSGLVLMYLAAKVVIVDVLLEFILATIIHGWKTAVRLLPSFFGRHIDGVIDPLALPIIKMADMARNLTLSVVMGFVSLALFLVVFRISLDIKGSAVVVLSVTGIVAAVLHAKKETKWLRPVTLAMSIIALIVTATVSVARASVTVADIRHDCIEQYLSHGIPKDAKMVKLCEANVEPGIMTNLKRFAELNSGKNLSPAELAEWNALDTVLKAAMEGKQKPLFVRTPPVPRPAPTATLPATAPATTPAPKPKATKVRQQTVAPKVASNDVVARMLERQKNVNKLLGR